MKTDQEIWSDLKEGKQSALESIYNKHIDYLLQYGAKFSRDTLLVEDCVHDLFFDLWRNRSGLSMTNSIRAYLLVALRRSIIKRSQKRQKQFSDKEPEEFNFKAELAIDEVIIQGEISAEQAAQLNQAIQDLSSRQREVLYLKYFQEVPYEEIAEIMDIGYQSVRNLVSSAIKALRKHMDVILFLLVLLH